MTVFLFMAAVAFVIMLFGSPWLAIAAITVGLVYLAVKGE